MQRRVALCVLEGSRERDGGYFILLWDEDKERHGITWTIGKWKGKERKARIRYRVQGVRYKL